MAFNTAHPINLDSLIKFHSIVLEKVFFSAVKKKINKEIRCFCCIHATFDCQSMKKKEEKKEEDAICPENGVITASTSRCSLLKLDLLIPWLI